MKITQITAEIEPRTPNPRPIRDALQTLPGADGLRVVVATEAGVRGESHTFFGRVAGGARALQALVEHVLAPAAIGHSAFCPREVREHLARETEYHGTQGLATWGISAIDVAIWDAAGKHLGQPCHRLWGACRDRIPAYAMVGWLNYSVDELAAICGQAVQQGFRAVKVKVGAPSCSEDLQRLTAVRHAIGHDVQMMVDANQALTAAEAIRRGRMFEDLGCAWFEEPVAASDHEGLAQVAQALDIPIASGENEYGKAGFRDLLARQAVDVVQADLRRAGGASEILEIGALAAAFGRPYASHGGGPVDLHLLACIPTARYAELGLLGPSSRVKLEDGCVAVPNGPGFSWDG